MCLGIPGKVTKVKGKKAEIKQAGHCHWVDISMLKKVQVGDYLLTYQEAAINKVNPEQAKEILTLFEEADG